MACVRACVAADNALMHAQEGPPLLRAPSPGRMGGDFKPLHDQGGLAAVARALRAQSAAAPPQSAPALPRSAPLPRAAAPPPPPAVEETEEVAPPSVRAYAAFRAAEDAAARAAAKAPSSAAAGARPAPAFRELYADEFMSSFGDELEGMQRGSGAAACAADARLLVDCIRAGADAFSADEQALMRS